MNRKKIKFSFFSSKIITIIVIIIIIYASFGLVRITWQNYQVNQKISDLDNEIKKLDEENFELQSKIAYYKTNAFKERQAREKLNLQRPGEIVIVVSGSQEPVEDNTEKIEKNKKNETNYKKNYEKWWDYFFGKKS